MAKCAICEKSLSYGNKLSIARSHVSNRATRTWKPNLRTVKAMVDGQPKRIKKFKADKKLFYGELNYTIDDKEKTIVETTAANTVGYNYGELGDVHNYLIGQGYSEV